MQRPTNAKLLINKLKDDKTIGVEITSIASKLAETFGDEESESNDQDLLSEVNQIIGEPPDKQKEILEGINQRVTKNHLRLEFS